MKHEEASETTKAYSSTKKVLLGVAQGMSQTRAAIAAGYSPKTAHVTGHNIIRKHKVEYLGILEKHGVTDEKIAALIVNGLDACKHTEYGVEKDYAIRHKYLVMALDLKGHFAPKKSEVELKGVSFEKLLASLKCKEEK